MATKKATKATAAPVVSQDETFVSLTMSKGLGESDSIAIEDKLRALYNIQQVDTEIDKIILLRGELPEEVKNIEDEIEGLNARIAKNEGERQVALENIASFKQRITEAEEAIAKYSAQQDKVKNNREFESIAHEIEYQQCEIEACQKHIKDSQDLVQAKDNAIAEAKSLLALREEDLKGKKAELETIVEETAKDEERLLKERAELEKKVDQRMLNAYTRVRSNTKNKRAVVTIERGACGGCFNNIPPQRQLDVESSKKIIVCEYCGRILVSSSFATPKAEEK